MATSRATKRKNPLRKVFTFFAGDSCDLAYGAKSKLRTAEARPVIGRQPATEMERSEIEVVHGGS